MDKHPQHPDHLEPAEPDNEPTPLDVPNGGER